MLTWGLLIATYNRADILPACIGLATGQSRPPAQVVVVDASDDWESSRTVIEELLADTPGIELTYAAAEVRSLTAQRNQGLQHVATDVVFMLDDDSLMHPGCAEGVLAVYEADHDGAVAGVQTGVDPNPPGAVQISGAQKSTGALRSRSGRLGAVQRWIERHLLLMDVESRFIPYDGAYPVHAVPAAVGAAGAQPARLFTGFRMTYRTEHVATELFDGALRSYCPGEDTDASYRVSRHGALVTAPQARLCHYQSASGRIDRRRTELLSALNQAFFLRRNAVDLAGARRRYFRLMTRRLAAEAVKDLGSRRWDLPQVRGVLSAVRRARAVFARDAETLEAWYVDLQLAILEGRAS